MASKWDAAYDGNAKVNVEGLAVGKYDVEVQYNGNENYNKATASDDFIVSKENVTVSIESKDSITVGESQVINITVDNVNATGEVIINIDGENHTVPLDKGKASYTYNGTVSGNHTVSVYYKGDKNFTGNWSSKTFEVVKIDSYDMTMDIANDTVGNKQTITVHLPDNATGQVLIDINGTPYYANVTDGKAVLELDSLPEGNYPVTATYLGDGNYTGKSISDDFSVDKNNSTLTIETQTVVYGDNEVIIFNVPEDATGNITVKVNNKTYTVAVSGGKGNLTVPKLPAGNYTVEATYNGDGKYKSSENSAKFEVTKLKLDADDIKVFDQGNGTVVVVVPENATGNITIKIGDKEYEAPIEDGVAKVIINDTEPGEYNVEVLYSGDDNYENASTTSKVTVPKVNAPIDATVQNTTVGTDGVITVTVPDDAKGNITIEIDGKNYTKPVQEGKATFDVGGLTDGNKTIAIYYSGDDKYLANFTTASMTVSKVTPEITINVATNGDDIIVNVTAPDDVTGPVLVDVNGVGYYVNITDGKGRLVLPDMAGGDYNVTARYPGDDKYGPSSNVSGSAKITDLPSTVTVKVDNITYGDKAVVEVAVPEDATGTVTVTIDGKDYTANVTAGKALIVVPDLKAGNYTADVSYSGDGKYKPSSNSTEFEVAKETISPDEIKVVDQGNGTVVVVVPENATGNVTVEIDGKNYTAPIKDGVATIDISDAAPGEHEVKVIYSGDDNFDGTTTDAKVTSPKHDTPISVSVDDITVGDNATVTVSVPDDANGNVTIEIDGKEYTAPIKDGKAVFTIDNLAAGNKTIAVKYSGDENYVANSTTASMTVSKDTPKVTVDVTTDGDDIIIDVTAPDDVTDPVLVDVNGVGYYVNITDGKGRLVLPDMAGGDYEITARYPGDDKYSESDSVSASAKITDIPSTVTVKVDDITYGDNAVVEVTVPEDATGTVTVTIDGKTYTANVTAGKALIVVPDLKAGDYPVDVSYSGDDKYKPSSNSTDFNVAKETISPDEMKVVDQGNGTVVVVVPENATGNVTVEIDGKNYTAPIKDGVATIDISDAAPGEHDIKVTYSGDDNFDGATTDAKATGPKLDAPVKVTVDDITVGDTAVVTVEVPKDATGTVTVEIDGEKYTAEIKDGKAVFNIKDLTAGNKTIAVEYSGDDKYLPNHTTDKITVSKAAAPMEVEIDDVDAGDNVTVTVKLPKDATGQVLIDIDGVGYYVNITDGVGVASIPRVPSGSYEVFLRYTGDDKYNESTATASLNVTKVESFVIPVAEDIYVGEDEVITVYVPQDATGSVTVVIDGDAYEFDLGTGTLSVPDSAEVYTIAVDQGTGKLVISGLPKGEYTASVKYNGDGKYLPSTNSTTFRVIKSDTPMDVIDLGNDTVVVTLPEDATGTVTVKVGDKTYTAKVENGIAEFDFSDLTPGQYPIEVSYSGDKKYSPQKAVSTVTIPKYDTPIDVSIGDVKVGETAEITVSVPEGATGTVTIEIDGVEYTSEIKNGKATFNVDGLTSGDKTVVVKYVGDENYSDNFTSTQFTVSKNEPAITAKGKDIQAGKDEIITVNVPSDATGRVLVKINDVGYYADVINGKAKVIIPELPAGRYTAVVVYDGDDKYSQSEPITVSFTVTKATSPISASGDIVVIGDDSHVTVQLPEDATGIVTITVDGRKYSAELVDGKAVFVIPDLPVGKYVVDVDYSGDKKYDSNSTTTLVVIKDKNGTGDNNGSDYPPHKVSLKDGVSLSEYPTAIPIWLLLVALITIGLRPIRRFRK